MTYGSLQPDISSSPRPAPQRQGSDWSEEWSPGNPGKPRNHHDEKAKRAIRGMVETIFPIIFLGGIIAMIGYSLFTVIRLFNT